MIETEPEKYTTLCILLYTIDWFIISDSSDQYIPSTYHGPWHMVGSQ